MTALAGQVQVHSAKIIVEQTAAVATKIYIPLANSTYTLEHASDTGSNGQVISTTSATYTTRDSFTKWNRNDALYDAIASGTPWTLETVTSNSGVTTSANAALFSNNVQITGAITTVTGGTANTNTLKTVSFGIVRTGALTLTDMNRYFVQHNSASTASILGGAFVIIQAHD